MISTLWLETCMQEDGEQGEHKKKKAGEYSEEDTHRPAHHYREVAVRRTSGRFTGQSVKVSLEKETR
jgi:hypothetical protein